MDQDERKTIAHAFHEAVNMAPAALGKWLEGEDSKAVGWTREGEKEAIGHKEGRRILEIKAKTAADLDESDYADMRKVVGYVHRHLAQRPRGDVTESRWRHSLMNWGHDPLKAD